MANRLRPEQHPSSAARWLEVEPLSEQRWSKIEQGVFERLAEPSSTAQRPGPAMAQPASRRWYVWAVAAAMLLVLGAGGFALSPLSRAEPALSRISTDRAASHLVLPGIVLDVSPYSAVVVSGDATESQLIVLDRGEVTCDVAHRRPGAPLLVQAGEVQVEVVGTRFRVARFDDAATVSVQEGVVKVSARGRSVFVRAGEVWPKEVVPAAPPEQAPAATPSPPPPQPGEDSTSSPRSLAPRAAAVAPTPQALFESASQLEARDPARAIQLYRELERGGGSWGKNALFAHGRLEAARGHRAEARRVLQHYLLRFPQGSNAADARLLLSQLE